MPIKQTLKSSDSASMREDSLSCFVKSRRVSLGKIPCGIFLTLILGCSHSAIQGDGVYHESAFYDRNSPPRSISSPSDSRDGSISIDETHLRSEADYHFSLGESYSLAGETTKALEEFRLTLVYDSESPLVHLRIAVEYVRSGLIGEAIESCQRSLELDPKYSDGRVLLGGIYTSLRMYDQAHEQYLLLVQNNPDSIEGYFYIGTLYAEQKRYDEAIEIFEKSLKIKSNDQKFMSYYYIGQVQVQKLGEENNSEAEESFRKSLKENPKYVDAVIALAQLYEKHGMDGKQRAMAALETFQNKYGPEVKVAEILSHYYLEENKLVEALEQLEVAEVQGSQHLGVKVKISLILIELKRFDEAIHELEEVLSQVPDSDKVRFYLGAVYEETQRNAQAVAHFRAVPVSSSFYPEAVIHMAYILEREGKLAEAIEVIEGGIKNNGDIPQMYIIYGALLEEKREVKKAVQILSDAVTRFPGQAQLLFYLGSLQDQDGNLEGTISSMKRVLEIDEKHVKALNYLAYTYAENDLHLDDAEQMVRKALEFEPKDPFILDTLGWVLYKKGEVAEAIRILERAYAEKQDESIIAEHLGDAYYRNQLPEKAKMMYLKAVAVDRNEKSIEKIRRKIGSIERQVPVPSQRGPASSSLSK